MQFFSFFYNSYREAYVIKSQIAMVFLRIVPSMDKINHYSLYLNHEIRSSKYIQWALH